MNDNPLRILIDEPAPDGRIDVGDVLAAGRRRVRLRRAATVSAAALVLVAAGTPRPR